MTNYVLNNADLEYIKKRENKANSAVYNGQTENKTEDTEKNRNGALGGAGYLLEKVGLGALSGIEGIVDYTAGGIAKLFGNDEYAKSLFANDWTNYNHADGWFNPSSGWKTAGDVAGGIGTSLPAIAAATAITLASGGTLSPLAGKLVVGSISASIAGLGAAGNATKEAYRETGELTGKEFGYGALSGATEAGIEFATAGIGKGTGRIVSGLAKKASKEAAEATAKSVGKTVAKTGAKQFFKQVGEDFVSEAFEEGFSEFISPYYQRLTYNPDAENASPDEIAYAALIGGLSGVVMSGGSYGANAAINSVENLVSGKKSVDSQTYSDIIKAAGVYTRTENTKNTGIGALVSVKDTYAKLTESLKLNNGIESDAELASRMENNSLKFNAKELMLLGKLKKANVIAALDQYLVKAAQAIILDSDNAARKYSEYGIKDASGKTLTFTKDDILSGISSELVDKAKAGTLTKAESAVLNKELRQAFSKNSVLATLAATEATGELMINSKKISELAISGEINLNSNDLTRLFESAKPEELKALSAILGVEDVRGITERDFNTRLNKLRESGELTSVLEQFKRILKILEVDPSKARPLPHILRKNMNDGVYRYTGKEGKLNLAILKEGESYFLYDYDARDLSRALSVQEVNKVLRSLWTNKTVENVKSDSKVVTEDRKEYASKVKTEDVSKDTRYAIKFLSEEDLPGYLRAGGRANNYKQQAVEIGNKIILTTYDEVRGYIKDAIAGKKDMPTVAYGKVDVKLSKETSDYSDGEIQISNFYLELVANDIRHSYQEHLNAKEKGDIDLSIEDFINIPHYVATYDDFVYAIKYKSGNTKICLSKKTSGGRVLIIEAVSKSHGSIEFKNMIGVSEEKYLEEYEKKYKKRNSTNTRGSESSNNSLRDETASNPIIPENTEKINPSDEKNSKKTTKDESKLSKIAIDNYAKENVDGYSELNDANKVAVRTTIRQARYYGVNDSDIKLYATVAVKSGLNVMFDVSAGDGVLIGNTIYVNPKISAERTHEMLLGHEMFHKIFASGDKRALKLYFQARKLISSDKAKAVEAQYKEFYGKLKDKDAPKIKGSAVTAEVAAISQEEVAAAGAEEVFKSADAWSYILGEEPTLADKVLGFFRKSAQKYSSIEGLSAQARKFVRQYKALFESLAERNQGNNALSIALEGAGAKKMPVTNTETDSMHVTGDNDEEAPVVTNTDVDTDTRFALIGRTEDGRGIYRTNYPENTPKDVKQKDIVDLVQNVWSKNPIKLNLIVDGKEVPIEARFNPELTERSDLSKIAFGNRKGTASEKRITMNLSSDLYQIAEESHHVGSKTESGKNNAAHAGVTTWHYFLTDLVYVETDGTEIECYMNIDVKQNDSGHWFYSFAIEKGSRPADVLSVVTDKSATTSTISITENAEKSNPSDENSSKNPPKKRFALSKDADTKVIHGYTLNKNADVNEDLLEELRIYDPSAEVSVDGRITVYHRTSEESAAAIRKTGIMRAKEDALFFSSKSEGYASDYGDTVLTFKIPSTQLRINDIFEGEVHFDMPLKRSANGWSANVKSFLDEGSRFALPENFDIDAAASKYSYDTLIKKPDLNVVTLPDSLPKTEAGRINNKAVVLMARNNAKKQENPRNTPSETYVYVKDIDSDVMIRRNGLEHGLARDENTALATIKIGDLLKNGIVINELNGRTTGKRTTEMSCVLFAVGQNKNSPYLVRIIVDKTTNSISEISTHGLYAIKAKKEGALFMPEGNEAVSDNRSYPYLRSTISIADFLEKVKNIPLANEIFSEDVAKKLGVNRSTGSLSEDVRFALPENFDIDAVLERGLPIKPGGSGVSAAQDNAYAIRYETYSKKSALEVIKKMHGSGNLTKKTQNELASALWQGFNECKDATSRQLFAHDIAEYITAKMITEAKVERPEVEESRETLSYLAPYIGRISFRAEELSEIRHNIGNEGLKSILGRWGYKGRNGVARVPMDVFVVDISREIPGMSKYKSMNPVDAFIELAEIYGKAKDVVNDKWISAFWDVPDSYIPSLVSGLEADIIKAFETESEKSRFAKAVEAVTADSKARAERWKAEYDELSGRNKLLGLLMNQAQKMKDLRLGTYANATEADNTLFKNTVEKLARINFRGNLNVTGTRGIIGDLLKWYRKDNPLLEYVDENNPGFYVQDITDTLESLSNGKKGFTKEELKNLLDVMSHFVHFVENYGKVFRNGKMVEALPEAERYIQIMRNNADLKVGLFAKLAGSWYAELFNDPASVVRRMDYYENGFYTEMFEDLRRAATDADVAEMRVMNEYDTFLRSNKKYIENTSKELIEYRGYKIPRIQLIDVYMTSKRKHAQAGLAINGFTFKDLEGKVQRIPGFVTDEHINEEELATAVTAEQRVMEKHFTDADRQYMTILEKVYNEDARKLKVDRDMQRFGFTNAMTDYYYPIKRAYSAQSIDTDAREEYDRVSKASFNKDTVRGAKQELAIESADARFRRHVHAVCQYAFLSPTLETFNRLYNLTINGNPNHPVSVRTEGENVWGKGHKYFKKLIDDIQGIPTGSGEGMAILGAIRSGYAKFQLGANLKVLASQFSSLFASSSMLDAKSLTEGLIVSAKEIDKYCPLAALRNYDNTAALAQGVLDREGKARGKTSRAIGKINKLTDVLMAPIGKVDRFVIGRLFGACQIQVERNGGPKINTEENKIEAGKLLEKVILETQQNSIATERSAAMRSGNEVWRALTMFSADGMKVIGRVIDAFGELSVLRSKLRNASDPDVISALAEQRKIVRKKAFKASIALLLTAAYMAGIAQGFRLLCNKEQEEEEIAQTVVLDGVGNLFGGLPLIRDAASFFIDGYDIDNYSYSALNDLLSGAKGVIDLTELIIKGEATGQDVALKLKNATYAFGQIFGVPVRNVYNLVYGLTKRFSPEAAYQIDSSFYKKNYQSDLYKAVEKGDEKMVSHIMSLLYNERIGTDVSVSVHNELFDLAKKGYKVLPKSAPSKITVDGEEYELTESELSALRNKYSASHSALEKLFASVKYSSLSDEKQAEAVKYVYDLYYDVAIENTLGVDRGNATALVSVVGADVLAMLYVATKEMTSDKDKDGSAVSGSKRKKVIAEINKLNISAEQKLLLICAKGYTIKDGDIRGLSAENAKKRLLKYIITLKGKTKEERAEIAKMCGFKVKNGAIVPKS